MELFLGVNIPEMTNCRNLRENVPNNYFGSDRVTEGDTIALEIHFNALENGRNRRSTRLFIVIWGCGSQKRFWFHCWWNVEIRGSFRRVRLQLTAANNISGFSNDSDICERISNIRNMKDNLENRKKIS